MDVRSLLSCISVAMLGIAIWAHLPGGVVDRGLPRMIALGLLTGLSAAGSMLVPMQIEPGLIFNFRVPLLATAGMIGGSLAGCIAAACALACRLYLGGIGMWAGVCGIGVAASLGALTHVALGRRPPRGMELGEVSALVSFGSFVTLFLLPWSKWRRRIKPSTRRSVAAGAIGGSPITPRRHRRWPRSRLAWAGRLSMVNDFVNRAV